MTVRPIVITGEPVLHRGAALITSFDDDLADLVADLWDTLVASGGVGLAAPQIGVGKRVFVYDLVIDDTRHAGCFVNPVVRAGKVPEGRPDPDLDNEGCLSVPGFHFPLRRAAEVRIDGLTDTGERQSLDVDGFLARCMQHETDHLNGRLYVDRLDPAYSKKARKAIKREGWGRPGHSWTPGVDADPFADGDVIPDAE